MYWKDILEDNICWDKTDGSNLVKICLVVLEKMLLNMFTWWIMKDNLITDWKILQGGVRIKKSISSTLYFSGKILRTESLFLVHNF